MQERSTRALYVLTKEEERKQRSGKYPTYDFTPSGVLPLTVGHRGMNKTIDSPSQALREYVQWTRRYIEHADPIRRFFDALQKDDSAKYYHFERRW